jgi:hypothetical protein
LNSRSGRFPVLHAVEPLSKEGRGDPENRVSVN